MPKRETFAAARGRLFQALAGFGWQMSSASLKVPHATSPDGAVRLWFKPQSLLYSRGASYDLSNAHSAISDVRGVSIDAVMRLVERMTGRKAIRGVVDVVADRMELPARAQNPAGARGLRRRRNPPASTSEVSQMLLEDGQTLPFEEIVLPVAQPLVVGGGITYWRKSRAWAFVSSATSATEAAKVGARVRRGLVGKRNVPYWAPMLHELDLYVVFDGGIVKVDAAAAAPKAAKGPSIMDQRRDIMDRARAFFGRDGASLGGKEGAYALTISPALKIHKGLFGTGTLRAETLVELAKKLDDAIEKVTRAMKERGR